MNRRKIDALEYSEALTKLLPEGIFLTTKDGEKINTMMIGWGNIGRIWERPVFIVFVRNSRYTCEMLGKNPEFTINIPVNGFTSEQLEVCGILSGRDMDKISKAGLTPVESERVSVPAIREFPMTLECRVVCRQDMNSSALPEEIRKPFYTEETSEHVCFFGEILSAYVIED